MIKKNEFRTPPHCLEAEEYIIASALLGDAKEIVGILESSDFYKTAHATIFKVIEGMVNENIEVDLVSTVIRAQSLDILSECGGASNISKFLDIPVSTSIKYHINQIKAASIKRQMIQANHNLSDKCFDNNADPGELLAEYEANISTLRPQASPFYKLGDLIDTEIERLEKLMKNEEPPGITTGLVDIDDALSGGFHDQYLYVIGARPGMGKTAFGTRICRGAGKKGFPSLQLQLEMSKEGILRRELSYQSGLNSQTFEDGNLNQWHWQKIINGSEKFYDLPMYVDDSSGATIWEIQSKIRQFVKRFGKALFVIDYLDYIKGLKSDRKDLEIGTVTKGLKATAKELNVPIVLFCQLSRQCEARDDKRPRLSDLRNSGEIEQDADFIAFLYRDGYYDENCDHENKAEFMIRKNRHGKNNTTVFLTWIPHVTTFENYQRR